MFRAFVLSIGVVCSYLAFHMSPAISQTGGAGGPGGNAGGVVIYGNNNGTIIVRGGSGGSGGNANSTPGRILAPSERPGRGVRFVLRNSSRYIAYVRFHSRAEEWAWPGGNKSYVLNTRAPTAFRLRCNPGEKVCYGASTPSGARSWGVNEDGDGSCRGCCLTCEADREVSLTETLID